MDSVRLYYFKEDYNFGDMLNLDIFKSLFGLEVVRATPKDCEIVAIGSLLQKFIGHGINPFQYFKRPMYIWGTGFIKPDDAKVFKRHLKRRVHVCAVRGKLSFERICRCPFKGNTQYRCRRPLFVGFAFNITVHNRINLTEHSFNEDDVRLIAESDSVTKEQVDTICQNLMNAFLYKKETRQ